jgi:hypothetical protein
MRKIVEMNRVEHKESELASILGENKYNMLLKIRQVVGQRERFLKNTLAGKYTGRLLIEPGFVESIKPRFIIARKWNSWYPSYFDIEGGCYAFLLPNVESVEATEQTRPSVVVVDPGFKFLDTLRLYGVDVSDIGAIIVTHYHMDHMAGLVEFLTLVHEREGFPTCRVFLNETTFQFYKGLQTKNVEFCEIRPDEKILVAKIKRSDGSYECLYLRPFRCHHREIGSRSNTLGLAFEFAVRESSQDSEKDLGTTKISILGDTDGMTEYLKEYSEMLKGSSLIVLHLGTLSKDKIQRRFSSGESHLYDVGLVRLLHKISSDPDFESLKSIVISEFGLELSQLGGFSRILRGFKPPNDWTLFLNLFRSIDQKFLGVGLKSDEQSILNLELQIFGMLINDYLLSNVWLTERHVTKAYLCQLFGYISYLANPDKAEDARIQTCEKIQKLLGKYSFSIFTEANAAETIKKIRQDKMLVPSAETQKIAKSTVSLLIEVCPSEKRKDLVINLQKLTNYVGHQALGQIILRDPAYTAFVSSRVSRRIIDRYNNEPKVLPLREFSNLLEIPSSLSCLSLIVALQEELSQDVDTIANAGAKEYGEFLQTDYRFFDKLVDLLSGLAPKNGALLIGDVGFDAIIEYDAHTKKYEIRLRTEDDSGRYDYTPINNTKSVEDENGNIRYKKR